MKVLLTISIILSVAAVQIYTKKPCPKFCPLEYKPVCAYNGTGFATYGNQCFLDKEICEKEPEQELFQVSKAFCSLPDNDKKQCPEVCTGQYDPVCAYNGTGFQIYSNECYLEIAICNKKPDQVLYEVSKRYCSLPEYDQSTTIPLPSQ